MSDPEFWKALEGLLASCPVVIDRPRGQLHPRFPTRPFPYDYGYLQGTRAVDGGGIDVWCGSEPGRRLVGLVCTVDSFKREAEIKLLLGCNPVDIQAILAFTRTQGMQAELVLRPAGPDPDPAA